MCSPTRCRRCGLTTWSGCGEHVAEVKALVPSDQWCGGEHEDDSNAGGWLRRVLGN